MPCAIQLIRAHLSKIFPFFTKSDEIFSFEKRYIFSFNSQSDAETHQNQEHPTLCIPRLINLMDDFHVCPCDFSITLAIPFNPFLSIRYD